MDFAKTLEVGEDAGTSDRVYRFYVADSQVKEIDGVPYIQLHEGDYLYDPTWKMVAVVTKIQFERKKVLVVAECHNPFVEKFTSLQSGKLFNHIKTEVVENILNNHLKHTKFKTNQN